MLEDLSNRLERIESLLQTPNDRLDDFISEEEAKKTFRRGTTWFWELRKKGFPYTKLGAETYYRKKDLVDYFNSNLKKSK